MPELYPFNGIYYAEPDLLPKVASPPYDVISPADRKRLEALHPLNYVRLILPAGDDRYVQAATRFRSWMEQGVLKRSDEQSLYLYSSQHGHGSQLHTSYGVIGALSLEEFGAGDIYPHEKTMPGPKADRLDLMRATEANLEPLWFVAARRLGPLGKISAEVAGSPPLGRARDQAGVTHSLWRLPPQEGRDISEALGRVPVVVADGHHRYETAITYRDERRRSDGPGPWDLTLALISDPEESPPILRPIHRVARGLSARRLISGHRTERFNGGIEALEAEVFRLGPGTVGVYSADGSWLLRAQGELDTVYLTEEVLEPLGVDVTYEHHVHAVEARVKEGATGFLLAPVPLKLVIDRAMREERMPPKTTFFWPKPLSGLVLRDLREP